MHSLKVKASVCKMLFESKEIWKDGKLRHGTSGFPPKNLISWTLAIVKRAHIRNFCENTTYFTFSYSTVAVNIFRFQIIILRLSISWTCTEVCFSIAFSNFAILQTCLLRWYCSHELTATRSGHLVDTIIKKDCVFEFQVTFDRPKERLLFVLR